MSNITLKQTHSKTELAECYKIIADDKSIDGHDQFGYSTAFNAVGDKVAITSICTTINNNPEQGAVYIFSYNGTVWVQEAKLVDDEGYTGSGFGTSVDFNSTGDKIVVGIDDSSISYKQRQGAVYVYSTDGTAWALEAKLTASDVSPNDHFGRRVSINAVGDKLVVGSDSACINDDRSRGAAYIFSYNGTAWVQDAKLTASDGATYDYFGGSVAINSVGDKVVIGADSADINGEDAQGAIYIYCYDGDIWTEDTKLIDAEGASNYQFGFSVAFNDAGDKLAVGSMLADVNSNKNQGVVNVYSYDDGVWELDGRLVASDGTSNAYFSRRLDINGIGDKIVVGADGTKVNGKRNQGAVYVYSRNDGSWREDVKLTIGAGNASDYFGWSVSINGYGDKAIIGSRATDVACVTELGAVHS